MRRKKICVDKAFADKLKIEGIKKGFPTMTAYTTSLSKEFDLEVELRKKSEKKKKGFNYGF